MDIFGRIDQARAWSEEERLVLDAVGRLAREQIAPRAAELDRTGEFPWENVRAINELGLNGLFVPEAYGGHPVTFRLYLECVKLLTEACASTGIIYATNFHAMKPLVDFGTDEQRARLLPIVARGGLASLVITEPTAGSDATGMRTRFTPEGDCLRIDGEKIFITSGDVASVMLVFGKFAGLGDGREAVSCVLLERPHEGRVNAPPGELPGLVVARREEKLGLRASSTVALRFEGVRVPRENLLGAPGDGLRILLGSLNRSRPSIAAHALGIARAAFRDMVAWMNERVQSGRPIIEFQGNQFMLADVASELALAEVWLDHLAALMEQGREDIGVEASIAKLRASDLAVRMATEAVQMHGGYGYVRDYRVERLYRDARITQIWEGTNQIHRQLIGRSFRGRDTRGGWE